jgi:hypothetical protein
MVKKYNVSCYAPPSALKIKSGDNVEVKGWRSAENIRADTITNITETGSICRCGTVMRIVSEKLPKWVEIKGKVGKVIQSTEGIEFELTTTEE